MNQRQLLIMLLIVGAMNLIYYYLTDSTEESASHQSTTGLANTHQRHLEQANNFSFPRPTGETSLVSGTRLTESMEYDFMVDIAKTPCTSAFPPQALPQVLNTKLQTRIMLRAKETSLEPSIGVCNGCFSGKQLITVDYDWICGSPRIGNKMFMLANAVAVATSWNATLVLPGGCLWIDLLKDSFCTIDTTVPLLPREMVMSWNYIIEKGSSIFQAIKNTNQNLSITGYRQSWKYFASFSSQKVVREFFKFSNKYEMIAKRNINSARQKFDSTDAIYIGVHMRIGDLLRKRNLLYGYIMANGSFYRKAMEYVTKHFSRSTIFVVSSDSRTQAKEMLKGLEDLYKIFWINGNAYSDLATLSKCNHSIISGGTYGFWAAWLAGGETFFYPYFSRKGSLLDKEFISSNFYLPQWTPIY